MNFESLLQFIKLTHEFQQIKREMFVTGEDRKENDLEHSAQLAFVAWYIADSEQLPLDKNLLIKYSMIHDLVEVYAGDTYIFADDSMKNSKAQREEAARMVLLEKFPEFPELHELIESYERRDTKEAEFVYALDKLLPMLNIYLDDGKTWKSKDHITLDRLVEYKNSKIAVAPDVEPYYIQLIEILRTEEQKYFNI